MSIIIGLMAAMFIIRLAYLKLSIANEKALRKNGAKEYGVGVSKAITFTLYSLFITTPMTFI